MTFEGLELSILGPACIAGLLVLATHVPLGQQVLARGIIFIDLAIAQVAALGVILAQAMGVDEHGYGVEIAAAIAALVGGALLTWTDRKWPEFQEPIIGTLFVLAATGALLLLANNPHGGEHLKDLLVGQILWVSASQLVPVAILSAILLAAMWIWRAKLSGILFYGIFALAITASVQLVGVYLVFASLIVPALATTGIEGARRRLAWAYATGIAGYVSGLVLSAIFDLPSGAMIVWTLVACGIVARIVFSGAGAASTRRAAA
ncbi:MAG TPA: metal ABC transporter permease [Rhodanobacteraceae bacterium]|jgi:zinc/manganese transport system permease protein|nr:metal ABC transporter permease [Rhodanobacteraceae bacterium]